MTDVADNNTDNDVDNMPDQEEKKFSQSDVESIVKKRLASANQKFEQKMQDTLATHAAQAANDATMQSQIANQAPPATNNVPQGTLPPQMADQSQMSGQPQEQMVPLSQVHQLVGQVQAQQQNDQKLTNYAQKLQKAGEEDPEFKQLLDNNVNNIPNEMVTSTWHLDQPAAVLNHLMTSPDDKAAFDAIDPTDNFTRINFVNQLNRQIQQKQTDKNANNFKPVNDVGNGGTDDGDMSEFTKYIREKGM